MHISTLLVHIFALIVHIFCMHFVMVHIIQCLDINDRIYSRVTPPRSCTPPGPRQVTSTWHCSTTCARLTLTSRATPPPACPSSMWAPALSGRGSPWRVAWPMWASTSIRRPTGKHSIQHGVLSVVNIAKITKNSRIWE